MAKMFPSAVVSSWLFIMAAAGGTAGAQVIYTPLSNLNQPPDDSGVAYGTQEAGASFVTGGTSNHLLSVSVSLSLDMEPGTVGPIILTLCSDAGGSPGGILETLSGNSSPNNRGAYDIYTYTNSIPLLLSANTTYWIVASSPGTSAPSSYDWSSTDGTGLDAGSSWTLGLSEYYYQGTWAPLGEYLQFSVTMVTTNIPALAISQPVVLTYPTFPSVPFVLQESPVLPGANWVTATNAIQITNGIVFTNQTVFLVPPTGRQMYFRLGAP